MGGEMDVDRERLPQPEHLNACFSPFDLIYLVAMNQSTAVFEQYEVGRSACAVAFASC